MSIQDSQIPKPKPPRGREIGYAWIATTLIFLLGRNAIVARFRPVKTTNVFPNTTITPSPSPTSTFRRKKTSLHSALSPPSLSLHLFPPPTTLPNQSKPASSPSTEPTKPQKDGRLDFRAWVLWWRSTKTLLAVLHRKYSIRYKE